MLCRKEAGLLTGQCMIRRRCRPMELCIGTIVASQPLWVIYLHTTGQVRSCVSMLLCRYYEAVLLLTRHFGPINKTYRTLWTQDRSVHWTDRSVSGTLDLRHFGLLIGCITGLAHLALCPYICPVWVSNVIIKGIKKPELVRTFFWQEWPVCPLFV